MAVHGAASQAVAYILGSAQDGGVPQIGCRCERCEYARSDARLVRFPASVAIFSRKGKLLLIDATPSLPQQLDLLRELVPSSGKMLPDIILLTHAHIGHYSGLMFLGRGVASSRELPVYCTSGMRVFLESNKPFKYLTERRELRIIEFQKQQPIAFEEGLSITPVEVPHRNEDADTVAFLVKSDRSLFYAPDFDHYTETIDCHVRNSDISIVDGCFWSRQELPDRPFESIPHPTIAESMNRFKGCGKKIVFTHVNHTNPVLNRDSYLQSELGRRGFRLATEGMDIPI